MQRIKLKPKILENKEGKKEFVILPYDDFTAVLEILEDAQDLLLLREAKKKERKSPSISLSQTKKELGLS